MIHTRSIRDPYEIHTDEIRAGEIRAGGVSGEFRGITVCILERAHHRKTNVAVSMKLIVAQIFFGGERRPSRFIRLFAKARKLKAIVTV
jgi:hypothetical protein